MGARSPWWVVLIFYDCYKFLVKMTLRSAARPRRALARHSVGTYISSGTLQSHLCYTPITLIVHLFLCCHSLIFHLWVTWSARCPVNVSSLACQGFEACFYKALTTSLVVSEGFTAFCHLCVTRKASQSFPDLNEDMRFHC